MKTSTVLIVLIIIAGYLIGFDGLKDRAKQAVAQGFDERPYTGYDIQDEVEEYRMRRAFTVALENGEVGEQILPE